MSVLRWLPAIALGLGTAAWADDVDDDDRSTELGIRLGVGAALVPAGQVQPMGRSTSTFRIPHDRFFLELAPGFYLPASVEGPLSYGGAGMEIGGGWMLGRKPMAPYVGAGISSRLQLSHGDALLGAAPYLQAGIATDGIGDGRAFFELRAYQNVFPVQTSRGGDEYPTELAFQVGLLF